MPNDIVPNSSKTEKQKVIFLTRFSKLVFESVFCNIHFLQRLVIVIHKWFTNRFRNIPNKHHKFQGAPWTVKILNLFCGSWFCFCFSLIARVWIGREVACEGNSIEKRALILSLCVYIFISKHSEASQVIISQCQCRFERHWSLLRAWKLEVASWTMFWSFICESVIPWFGK